jgi:hypothetical protein
MDEDLLEEKQQTVDRESKDINEKGSSPSCKGLFIFADATKYKNMEI